MDWRPLCGVSCFPPKDHQDRLKHPHLTRPRRISGLENVCVYIIEVKTHADCGDPQISQKKSILGLLQKGVNG